MKKVLITGELPPEAKNRVERSGLAVIQYGANDLVGEGTFITALKDIEVYISGGNEKATAAVLDSARSLKLVVFLGTDCGAYIDISAASKNGITVCSTPGANALSVAELTVGLMLDAQRRITSAINGSEYKTTHTLHGKTVGLIGYGAIGAKVAEICKGGFGTQVQYWTRSGEKPAANELGARAVSLHELLSTSDIISLHVPSESGVLLDTTEFDLMKPGATIINTCAASLMQAKPLLEMLQKNPSMSVAFDCFYESDEECNNPAIGQLRELIPQQVLVTPHVAWRTFESDIATYDMALSCISEFMSGQKPQLAVN